MVQQETISFEAGWNQGELGRGRRSGAPFKITVHNGEEHLKEQIDGVYEDCQQV